jgi:hypothetical protein
MRRNDVDWVVGEERGREAVRGVIVMAGQPMLVCYFISELAAVVS